MTIGNSKPDNTIIELIRAETNKIDNLAVDGLLGVKDSLSYKVGELERHFHNWTRGFGAAAVPNGEIHVADPINDNPVSFVLDGGSDAYGAWVQILGSGDTPFIPGSVYFDFHNFLITAFQRQSTLHLIQFGCGESGAAALTAGTYSERDIITGTAVTKVGPIVTTMKRCLVGVKVWARIRAVGQVSGTLAFTGCVHEYPG